MFFYEFSDENDFFRVKTDDFFSDETGIGSRNIFFFE